MAKAILEFSLPEEAEEYRSAVNASDNYSIIWDIRNELRLYNKYELLSKGQLILNIENIINDNFQE